MTVLPSASNDAARPPSAGFYVTGGTLGWDAVSYVARRADADLNDSLRAGEFCYVLTSRQMGKSSLMIRTANRLREQAVRVALIDLTKEGQNLSVDQWYSGLIQQAGRTLGLEEEVEDWWDQHEERAPLRRWMAAIEQVVLARDDSPVVIFIDEVDFVRSLPFPTDELFAAIRECYNRRTQEPALRRLTFCLLGVATPADLIRDVRTTPFNIGRRIELTDFTEAEAAPLAAGLGKGDGPRILRRIIYWTGGHPYLTQRLCQSAADANITDPGGIDRLCEELFLSSRARESDNNLIFVHKRLLDDTDRAAVLDLYRQVWQRKRVPDDDANPVVTALRLSGVTRVNQGVLQVRNRIYFRAFDKSWMDKNLPNAEAIRQRAAYRKGLLRASLLGGVAVAVLGAAVGSTIAERNAAKAAQKKAQDLAENTLRTASATDQRIGHLLLERNEDAEALACEARALREDPTNQGAVFDSIALLFRSRLPAAVMQHRGAVASVAFSPDGRRLVTACWDNTAQVWDALTGLPVGEPMRHLDGVRSASFSPDGTRVLTASWDSTAQIWDAATGGRLGEPMRHGNHVLCASFSPDGTRAVTASDDKTAQVWDAATGKRVGEPMHDDGIKSALFSPDGTRVLTASSDGNARLWDAATGKQCGEPMHHEKRVYTAFFNTDGSRVVTASDDGTAQIWDAACGKPTGKPIAQGGLVVFAKFSPDSTRVLTLCSDNVARVWDASTGKLLGEMAHARGVHVAAFSPDGTRIVTAGEDMMAHLWDASNGKPLGEPMRHDAYVLSLAFSPDGTRLVTGCDDMMARVWDTASGRPRQEPMQHADKVLMPSFSPDGARVVTASFDNAARVWDTASGALVGLPMKHDDRVWWAVFSPDGTRIVTASDDKTARIWDAATGNPVGSPMWHSDEVWSASFSRDGTRIITASAERTPRGSHRIVKGTAQAWDVASGKPLGSPMHHDDIVTAASFSPDGSRIITASRDGTARLWDMASGLPLCPPMRHKGAVVSAAFNFNGTRVVTASEDWTVRLWNGMNGNPAAPPMLHESLVNSAVFSQDGARVLSTSNDKTARLWDAATGQPIGAPMLHKGYVISALFSPDSAHVVTADGIGEFGEARIWDADNGKPLGEPMLHAKFAYAAMFSPDGSRVVTACGDGAARVWDVSLPAIECSGLLADLDELAAGQHFGKQGVLEWLPEGFGQRLSVIRSAAASPQTSAVTSRWIKWFLTAGLDRTISPLSSKTVTQWVRERVNENTPESLQAAWEADSNNGLCLARRARLFSLQNPPDVIDALEYIRLATQQMPNDPEIAWRRVAILFRLGNSEEARVVAKACAQPPPDDLWAQEAKWEACLLLKLDGAEKALATTRQLAAGQEFYIRRSVERCIGDVPSSVR